MSTQTDNSARLLLDLKLKNFYQLWRLQDERLFCFDCGASQPASSADEVFVHSPRCAAAASQSVSHPWLALQQLLAEVPTGATDDGARWRKLKKAGPVAAGWLALTSNSDRWDESIDKHLDLRGRRTTESQPPVFTKGETDHDRGNHVAGVNVGSWDNRIEIYGGSPLDAEALRDAVLDALISSRTEVPKP